MERDRKKQEQSTQWNYVGMKTVSAVREVWRWLRVDWSPASSGRRRAIQGNFPRFAAAPSAELAERPAWGLSRGSCGSVHAAGTVLELRVRRLRRRTGARQRRRGRRGAVWTSGFVAGGVALRTGSARAVLSFLLRVAHLHLLTVGSYPVLQRQRTVPSPSIDICYIH